MTNKDIEFRLTLIDGLTAKWNAITTKMVDGVKKMAETFQKYWASITAGWMAVSGAVRTGFEWMEGWAKGEVMMGAFKKTMEVMGRDAEVEFSKIRTASAGLIDEDSLTEMANKWLGMSLPIEKLADVMTLARIKAREMGISAKEAFDTLTTALAAGQVRGLKSMNIAVDSAAAEEAYARTLGKTAAALTEVEKRQAILNAVLDAGKTAVQSVDLSMATMNEKIQQVQATIEEAKDSAGQAFARIALGVASLLGALLAAGIQLARVFIWPIARMEEALSMLGLTTSTRMRDAEAELVSFRSKSMDFMEKTYSAMMASSDAISGSAEAGAIATNNMTNVANASLLAANYALQFATTIEKHVYPKIDEMAVRMQKVVATIPQALSKLGNVSDETLRIVKLTAQNMEVSFGDVYKAVWEMNGGFESAALAGLDAMHSSIVDGIGSAWEDMFGQANSLLEIFIKNFVQRLGDIAVKSAISGLLSLIPGAGFFSGLFGGLFHEGGTVPKAHGGAFINAPSNREFPILVRGGETIRTESQEASVQAGLRSGGQSTTLHVNVYGPIADEYAFKEMVERGMRKLGITDVAQYFKNNRSNLALQA